MAVTIQPDFTSGEFLRSSQMKALEAAIPSSIFDLIPPAATAGQILVSTGTNSVKWTLFPTASPNFTGAATFCSDSRNYFMMNGGASNQSPIFAVVGGDLNVGLDFQTSGNGQFAFRSNNSKVNLNVIPDTTSSGFVTLSASASSGTGAIKLAANGSAWTSLDKSPTANDNSTNIATTAWVNTFIPQYLSTNGYTATGSGSAASTSFGYGTFTPKLSGCATGEGSGSYWLAGNVLFFLVTITVSATTPGVSGATIDTGLPVGLVPAATTIGYPINCSLTSTNNPADAYFVCNATHNGLVLYTKLGTYDSTNPNNAILFKTYNPQSSDFAVNGQFFITGIHSVDLN